MKNPTMVNTVLFSMALGAWIFIGMEASQKAYYATPTYGYPNTSNRKRPRYSEYYVETRDPLYSQTLLSLKYFKSIPSAINLQWFLVLGPILGLVGILKKSSITLKIFLIYSFIYSILLGVDIAAGAKYRMSRSFTIVCVVMNTLFHVITFCTVKAQLVQWKRDRAIKLKKEEAPLPIYSPDVNYAPDYFTDDTSDTLPYGIHPTPPDLYTLESNPPPTTPPPSNEVSTYQYLMRSTPPPVVPSQLRVQHPDSSAMHYVVATPSAPPPVNNEPEPNM